jgi:hypothetical protein
VTAASTSASAASGTVPMRSPVDALCTAMVAAERGGTHSPPMKNLSWLMADMRHSGLRM